MPLQNVITRLKQPLQKKRRLYALVIILLLAITGMAAAYYFHLEASREKAVQYKFRLLDSYFDKLSRRLDNDVLKKNATGQIIKEKGSSASQCNFVLDLQKDCLDAFVEKQLDYQAEFDHYLIVFHTADSANGKKDVRASSLRGMDKSVLEQMISSPDSLWFASQKTVQLDKVDYLMLGKRYRYELKGFTDDVSISIIGLITHQRFKVSSEKLNPWLVSLLVAMLLIMLVGIPFFKMIFISEDERLYSYDVIFAGISMIIGAPLLMILVLTTSHFFEEYYRGVPGQLEQLNRQLLQNFQDENTEILRQMKQFDISKYRERADHTVSTRDKDEAKFLHVDENIELTRTFKYISQVGQDGVADFHINFIREPEDGKAAGNLSQRSYFKDMKGGQNVWNYDSMPYVMRPVVSIENNSEEAVYIKRLSQGEKDSTYGVFSVQLKSLHNAILPVGFRFAVIDENGEVWFHSESGKSTLENFYTISDHQKELKAAINGRVAVKGEFDYHGEEHLYHCLPIQSTNLSIVCFYDLSLIGIRLSETLSICSLMFLAVVLFMVIVILSSVFLKNPKWRIYKYHPFLFRFLLPKKEQLPVYIFLTVCFLAGLLSYLVLPIQKLPSFLPLAMGGLTVFWSYVLVFFILKDKSGKELLIDYRSVAIIVIALALNGFLYKEAMAIGLSWWILCPLALQLAFVALIFIGRSRLISRIRSWISDDRQVESHSIAYKYWYVAFMYSWLISSSLFPAYVLYEKAKSINEEVWAKANLYDYTERYWDKRKQLLNEQLPEIQAGKMNSDLYIRYREKHQQLISDHLNKSQYLPNAFSELAFNEGENIKVSSSSLFRSLLWSSRPIYDEKVRRYQHLIFQSAEDDSWGIVPLDNGFSYEVLKEDGVTPKTLQITYRSQDESKGELSVKEDEQQVYYALNLIGIVILLMIFYWLILFYVDRFYGFRFVFLRASDFDQDGPENFKAKLRALVSHNGENSGLLLVGPPYTKKQTFAEEILKSDQKSYCRLDFLDLKKGDEALSLDELIRKIRVDDNNVKCEAAEAFVLTHFEHNILSFELSRVKVQLITHLIAKGKKLIITSEVFPSQFLEVYKDQVDEEGKMDQGVAGDFNSWKDILGGFPQVLVGVTSQTNEVYRQIDVPEFASVDMEQKKLLAKELGFSHYLPQLAGLVFSKCIYPVKSSYETSHLLDEQRMVIHSMHLAHGYYTDIWNSLPRREKYILYDLAKDGFMNVKNSNSLFSLMKKGLIVWEDVPRIFNKSFRNFIISTAQKDVQLNEDRIKMGQKGWGTVRVIMFLVMIAIVVFIIVGNPGILKDMETFYGALAGLGAIIPILSSVLGKSGRSQ